MAEKLQNRELQRFQRKVNVGFLKLQRRAAQTMRENAQLNGKEPGRGKNGNGKVGKAGLPAMFTSRLWF